MKSGILGPDQGFKILVNGVDRTFRDQKAAAYDAALVLKKRSPQDTVQIMDLYEMTTVTMKEDGRTD